LIGCGSVGLSIVQAARVCTDGPVIAIDLSPDKLRTAVAMGASHALLVTAGEDLVRAVRALTGGHGIDFVFDAVGSSHTVQTAVECCDIGGTALVIGTPAREDRWSVALGENFHRRLIIKTCNYGDVLPHRDVPLILDLYRQGRLRLDDMVSSVIDLADAPGALEALRAGTSGVRTVIRMPRQ